MRVTGAGGVSDVYRRSDNNRGHDRRHDERRGSPREYSRQRQAEDDERREEETLLLDFITCMAHIMRCAAGTTSR